MVHFENTFLFQSLLKDEAALKIHLISVTSSYNSFSDNTFPNKPATRVPNNMLKNPPFCFSVSLLSVFVTPFNKILELQKLEQFSFCHSFLHLKLLKLLFLNDVFSFEFLHQLLKQQLLHLMELKYFLPKELQFLSMELLINLIRILKILQIELF